MAPAINDVNAFAYLSVAEFSIGQLFDCHCNEDAEQEITSVFESIQRLKQCMPDASSNPAAGGDEPPPPADSPRQSPHFLQRHQPPSDDALPDAPPPDGDAAGKAASSMAASCSAEAKEPSADLALADAAAASAPMPPFAGNAATLGAKRTEGGAAATDDGANAVSKPEPASPMNAVAKPELERRPSEVLKLAGKAVAAGVKMNVSSRRFLNTQPKAFEDETEAMALLFEARCRDIYAALDRDNDERVNISELKMGTKGLGVPVEELERVFGLVDADGDGLDTEEFVTLMSTHFGKQGLAKMTHPHQSHDDHLPIVEYGDVKYKVVGRTARSAGLFYPFHPATQAWELLIMIVLVSTIYTTPLSLGFEPFECGLRTLDLCTDFFFLSDVLRNFNTAAVAPGELIYDRARVAKRYAQGWFLPDLLTSLPYNLMLDNLPAGLSSGECFDELG